MVKFTLNAYSKEQQTHKKRIRPTQRQMGEISVKVRKAVRTRSGGICELKERCHGAPAVQQAHITSRKQITHRTTPADLLDSCLNCHRWLDEHPAGIKYKRQLRQSNIEGV